MTKAKELPVFVPSIHTFEVIGRYKRYEVTKILTKAIKKLKDEKKYHLASDKIFSYTRNGGGLTITLLSSPKDEIKYIKLSGVNLARIAGNPSRLALTNLEKDALDWQEDVFLNELDRLCILEVEDKVKWTMSRLDITQDFYVKSDPSLIMKIIRYAGLVDPQGKGHEKHHDQHNEIRSCKFEKTKYDFSLYDKHQQLLHEQKKEYPIPLDDLERSKNLVRYEIQLKRPFLKKFEEERFGTSRLRFSNHALYDYFREISGDIPEILYECAVKMFGSGIWHNAYSALSAVQKSDLDDDIKGLVMEYIKSQDTEEAREWMPPKKKVERALEELQINEIIIPSRILNDRQFCRFPCASLCSRVQCL